MRQLSAAVAVTSPQILVSLLKLHVPPAAATAATDVAMVQVDNSKCVSGGGSLVHTGEAIQVLALPFGSVLTCCLLLLLLLLRPPPPPTG